MIAQASETRKDQPHHRTFSLFSPLHKRSHGQTNFIASLSTKENGIRLIMERKNESNGSKGFIPGRYHNKFNSRQNPWCAQRLLSIHIGKRPFRFPENKVSGLYPSFRNLLVPKERKKTTIKKLWLATSEVMTNKSWHVTFFFADLKGNQRDRVREIEDFLGFYHHRFIYVRV